MPEILEAVITAQVQPVLNCGCIMIRPIPKNSHTGIRELGSNQLPLPTAAALQAVLLQFRKVFQLPINGSYCLMQVRRHTVTTFYQVATDIHLFSTGSSNFFL